MLSSLNTLLQWLQFYRALPHDRLRVFSSSSREGLDEQLVRENNGVGSSSVTAAQFLQERMLCSPEGAGGALERETRANQERASLAIVPNPSLNEGSRTAHALNERGMSVLERRRLEFEGGAGGDHDVPYTFTLPAFIPQVLAWTKLLVRVRHGVLQP